MSGWKRGLTPWPPPAPTSCRRPSAPGCLHARIRCTWEPACPRCPHGQHSYPMITAGAAATAPGEGVEKEAEACATITIVTADPERLTASYEWGQESAFRVAGLEPALQTDIRGVLQTAFDKKVVVDLLAALTNPDGAGGYRHPGDVPVRVLRPGGRHPRLRLDPGQAPGGHRDLSPGAAPDHRQHRHRLHHAAGPTGSVLRATYRRRSANDQNAIAYRIGSGMPPRLMAPVWRGMSLIRDIYTGRRQGKVGLTAAMFTNVKLTDQDTHKQAAFQISV